MNFLNLILIFVITLFAPKSNRIDVSYSPINYIVDQSRSEVSFLVDHLRFAKVRGEFKRFNAQLKFDTANPTNLETTARMDVSSLETGNVIRDGVLMRRTYFQEEDFHFIYFTSKSVQSLGDGRLAITGDLKIKDVTKSVTLETTYSNLPNNRLRFEGTTTINRMDFGVNGGDLFIGKTVTLNLKIEAVKRPN